MLFKIGRVVIAENRNFVGGEAYLKERGIEVVVLENEECVNLMANFIKEKPEIWCVGLLEVPPDFGRPGADKSQEGRYTPSRTLVDYLAMPVPVSHQLRCSCCMDLNLHLRYSSLFLPFGVDPSWVLTGPPVNLRTSWKKNSKLSGSTPGVIPGTDSASIENGVNETYHGLN